MPSTSEKTLSRCEPPPSALTAWPACEKVGVTILEVYESKVFDLLDEKRLSVSEMRDLLTLLIGAAAMDLPHPEIEWAGFEAALSECLKHVAPVYDPVRKQHSPWVNLSKLRSCYGGGVSCICM